MIARLTPPPAAIKGMFVNGHVAALRKAKGEAGVKELTRRFGRSVRFDAFESVPLRDEVAILEIILDLTEERALSPRARVQAAGVLHFKNFSETALGSGLMRSLPHTPRSFRTLLLNAPAIAHIVFDNTTFECDDVREGMRIRISNCDYAVEHFQGFFEEWMRYWGLGGTVRAREEADGIHEYRLSF